MSPEERKRLCERLCEPSKNDDEDVHRYELCVNAANEIERLSGQVDRLRTALRAATLAQSDAEPPREVYDKVKSHAVTQSDAEPVAWQFRWRIHERHTWTGWRVVSEFEAKGYVGLRDHEVRPLYATPPRPDASAGLIDELRKQIEHWDRDFGDRPPRPDASAGLIELRDMFRQKANECHIEFMETADPAAASAAYAYTEAAGELERLRDRIKE